MANLESSGWLGRDLLGLLGIEEPADSIVIKMVVGQPAQIEVKITDPGPERKYSYSKNFEYYRLPDFNEQEEF